MKRRELFYLLGASLALAAEPAIARVAFDSGPAVPGYAFEDKDWGVAPHDTAKGAPYHGATPTVLPGGRVIKTLALKALLAQGGQAIVVDVLENRQLRETGRRDSVPGAVWMPGVGSGAFYQAEKARYKAALMALAGGRSDRPLIFLCLNSECWLSYNAALRAVEAGFSDVIWYRGGTDAWHGASLDLQPARRAAW